MILTAQGNMLSRSILITQKGNFLSRVIDSIEEVLILRLACDKT